MSRRSHVSRKSRSRKLAPKGVGQVKIEQLEKLNKSVSNLKQRVKELGVTVPFKTKGVTSFDTLREYKAYIKDITTYLSKPIVETSNFKAPIEEIRTYKSLVNKANKQILKERNRVQQLETTIRGVPQNRTVEEVTALGKNDREEILPFLFNPNRFRSKEAFNEYMMGYFDDEGEFVKGLQEKVQGDVVLTAQEQMRENYFKAMENKGFLNEESGRELKKELSELPLKEFVDKFYSEKDASFDFVYSKSDLQERLKILREKVWNL